MIKYLPDFMIGLMIGLPMAGFYFLLEMLFKYIGA